MDEFFTTSQTVQTLLETLQEDLKTSPHVLEPSAGDGLWMDELNRRGIQTTGIDIHPQHPLVQTQDFLTYTIPSTISMVVGNPPFGRGGKLARAFLRHSMSFPHIQTVAFILPRSFTKPTMFRSPLGWFKSAERPLTDAESTFRVGTNTHKVPCVWQIWKRGEGTPMPQPLELDGIEWVRNPSDATHAFRRVGVYAGRIFTTDLETLCRQSHTFFRATGVWNEALSRLGPDDFPSNTTGPRSVGKQEFLRRLGMTMTNRTV